MNTPTARDREMAREWLTAPQRPWLGNLPGMYGAEVHLAEMLAQARAEEREAIADAIEHGHKPDESTEVTAAWAALAKAIRARSEEKA